MSATSSDMAGLGSFQRVFEAATSEHHAKLAEFEGYIGGVVGNFWTRNPHVAGTILDYDDLLSLARMAALKAIVNYAADRASLETHLFGSIQHFLRDELRRVTHGRASFHPTWVSFSASLDPQDPEGTPLVELFVDEQALPPDTHLNLAEVRSTIWGKLSNLPEQPQEVLRLYLLEELPVDQIALEFGVSDKRIYQIIEKGLQSLRGLPWPQLSFA